LADADKIQFVKMVDLDTKVFPEKTTENQQNFLN